MIYNYEYSMYYIHKLHNNNNNRNHNHNNEIKYYLMPYIKYKYRLINIYILHTIPYFTSFLWFILCSLLHSYVRICKRSKIGFEQSASASLVCILGQREHQSLSG